MSHEKYERFSLRVLNVFWILQCSNISGTYSQYSWNEVFKIDVSVCAQLRICWCYFEEVLYPFQVAVSLLFSKELQRLFIKKPRQCLLRYAGFGEFIFWSSISEKVHLLAVIKAQNDIFVLG